MKLRIFLMALVALLLPTVAFAAVNPEVTLTPVDLRPLLTEVLTLAVTVLSVLAMWAVRSVVVFLKSKTGVNLLEQEAILRGYVDTALKAGLDYATTQVKSADWSKVEVKNELVATAANYALSKVPDALSYFKIDESNISELIEARLPRLNEPAPTTVVVTPPATPAKAGR